MMNPTNTTRKLEKDRDKIRNRRKKLLINILRRTATTSPLWKGKEQRINKNLRN
jgi:hypothetical protein